MMLEEGTKTEVEPVDTENSLGRRPSKRLVFSTILGLAFVAFPLFFGFMLLANIGSIGEKLQDLPGPVVAGIPFLALVIYVVFFALTSGLGLLPTYAQSILGGWIFGFALGAPAALIGFTLGALIGWGFCRLVSKDSVMAWTDANPKWRAVRKAFVNESASRTLGLVTLIRFPPNSPFALTNLAMAAGGVRLLPYAVGTFLGMTPRTVIACAFAASAAATGATDIQTFVKDKGIWPLLIGLVVVVVIFTILSRIANKAIQRAL
jgi:uncharacterized membrane protein YdjX (TVP38/TMEM64 family)